MWSTKWYGVNSKLSGMKKKVLIHSLIFPPDGVSTAYLYGDIALALKKHGFEVEVLSTTPHYNIVANQVLRQPLKWKIWGVLKQSNFHGIKVLHVPQKKFKSTSLRLIGFVYWHIISFLTALTIKNIDIILSPSPPLTIGLLNVWLAKLKRIKVVYNVQEVYPDILGHNSGLVYKLLSRIEKYVYNNSAAVTTIDKIFSDTIESRFRDSSRLRVIPNFVDTELYRPLNSHGNLNQNLFIPNNHLKLLYAGNIGMAQEWDTLIELAKFTRKEPIDYYVIGEGVMRKYVKDSIAKYNLDNILLLPYQPRSLMPEIIAFSDIQFIFMNSEIAAQGFPSKVYTIMACARPLLVCSPANTPIVNFLDNLDCAKIIKSGSALDKAREIAGWLNDVNRDTLNRMGSNGYKIIQHYYSKEVVTAQYCHLLDGL